VGAEKPVKDPLEVLRGNPRAFIINSELHLVSDQSAAYLNRCTGRSIFGSVLHQIGQHMLHVSRIHLDGR
jgi:hypothetical protein